MKLCSIILVTAFVLDALLGDPSYRLHPVRLIGRTAEEIKRVLFKHGMNNLAGGAILAVSLTIISTTCYLGLRFFAELLSQKAAFLVDLFTVYSCIALTDLLRHIEPIIRSLDNGNLPRARRALSMVVGRNTGKLDGNSIARAAVESVGESFTDSVFSPVIAFSAGCMAGALLNIDPLPTAVCAILSYRTVNTLDSMVGYKNTAYRTFGTFSARLDDVLNWIPARLTVLPLSIASLICGFNTRGALHTFSKYRLKHLSPNSAHPESFVAGALDIKLGGPTLYPHGLIKKPWIGDGSDLVTTEHVTATYRLVQFASWISLLLSVMILSLSAR